MEKQTALHPYNRISVNIKGNKKNAHTMSWNVDIPAQEKTTLTFKVRMVKTDA